MGLRQQKRDRTEDAIVRAAYRLFAERGYDGTTVEEIAAASDVSPRTFYRYFASKDMTLAINGYRSVDEALQHVRPDAAIDELARCLAAAIERSFGYEHTQVAGRLLVEHPRLRNNFPVWRAGWAAHLADGLAVAAGRDRADASDRFRAQMAITITGFAVEERLRRGGEPELSDVVDRALRDLEAGLRGPATSELVTERGEPPSAGR